MNNTLSDSPQIEVVSSFSELTGTRFHGDVNAIFWQRNLSGDFKEIVSKLPLKENITEVSIDDLLALNLTEEGNTARQIIINDVELLSDFGAQPSVNLLKNYERDEEFDFISTDVYSYHVDRSPVETDTFLCTYFGAASDILPNDQSIQNILVPQIRERLKELHNGLNDDFETFLKDNYFDLHYQPKPGARPVNLGIGNLWKLAVDHPKQKVLPCVHRAPRENDGEYRLILIC
ncbi:DUF1826 domain-containing protein [Chryseobacterium daeguense]|uniref:DUF1826 domain-containing protein n=1 Tax=Chryseobacterium daeguense TaxID=412438 RepID=UPI00040348B2|nr:DUF1826 domain-containing protein [Chryseobacterium daeguense]